MTIQEAKDLIVQTAIDKQGMKATELVTCIVEVVMTGIDIPRLIDDLVKEKILIEVEYVLPTMNFQCKSFLLPADSRVRVINA
jgi:hypothetical protein